MSIKVFPELYKAGRVKRWHTDDVPPQELGQHQWGVAMVVRAIYPNHRPPAYLLEAALTHDLAESVTGDAPAPTKWQNPALDNELKRLEERFNDRMGLTVDLSVMEKRILAWADLFELCLYCKHHRKMGNQYAGVVLEGALSHLLEMGFPTSESKELFDHVFS